MAPPPVDAGGFTRLSKGLAVVLFAGHLTTLIFPWTINYLSLVPAKYIDLLFMGLRLKNWDAVIQKKFDRLLCFPFLDNVLLLRFLCRTIPFAWNIITAGYIEQSIFGLVLSILGLLFCGKLLEPIWTSKEFLKFIIFVNTITLVGVYITALTSYYITRREVFIYTPFSGFHGVLSGFLVGVKLTVPDEEIKVLGFHMRAEWLPSLLVLMSIVLSVVTPEAMRYLPFVLFGTYGGWLYLRYLQRIPETNLTGNPGDEFAFSTFFPHFVRPIIDALASRLHKLTCKRNSPSKGDDHLSDSFQLPRSDTAEASRWRERGSHTLDERLQDLRMYSAHEDQVPLV